MALSGGAAAWGEDMAQVHQLMKDEERIMSGTVLWFCIFAK